MSPGLSVSKQPQALLTMGFWHGYWLAGWNESSVLILHESPPCPECLSTWGSGGGDVGLSRWLGVPMLFSGQDSACPAILAAVLQTEWPHLPWKLEVSHWVFLQVEHLAVITWAQNWTSFHTWTQLIFCKNATPVQIQGKVDLVLIRILPSIIHEFPDKSH